MYAESVDNAKLRTLAFEDRWHYVALLCCKAQGIIDSTDPKILDRIIGVKLGLDYSGPESSLVAVKRRLIEIDLIDDRWQPTGWDERQFVSDSSRERTRKWRERKSPPNPPSEEPNTDSEQNRTERDVTSDVTVTLPQKTRATRIPEGWKPSDSLTAYAERQLPNVDVQMLAEEFADYWRAAAGERARKADWVATWRTLVRRSVDRYPTKRGPANAPQKQIRIDANGRVING
jgi:hypothetical protein